MSRESELAKVALALGATVESIEPDPAVAKALIEAAIARDECADLRTQLAEAERKLAGLKAYAEKLRVWLENDEPGFDLIDELWAVVNILDGKGE